MPQPVQLSSAPVDLKAEAALEDGKKYVVTAFSSPAGDTPVHLGESNYVLPPGRYGAMVFADSGLKVVNDDTDKLIHLDPAKGYQPDTSKELDLIAGGEHNAACSDGTNMWLVNAATNRAECHVVSTRAALNAKDRILGSGFWLAATATSTRLYFMDDSTKRVSTYNPTGNPPSLVAGEAISNLPLDGDYRAACNDGTNLYFVDNTRNLAMAVRISDRSRQNGANKQLPAGDWSGGAYNGGKFWFLDQRPETHGIYAFDDDFKRLWKDDVLRHHRAEILLGHMERLTIQPEENRHMWAWTPTGLQKAILYIAEGV